MVACTFQGIDPFHVRCQRYAYRVVLMFPYCSFDVCQSWWSFVDSVSLFKNEFFISFSLFLSFQFHCCYFFFFLLPSACFRFIFLFSFFLFSELKLLICLFLFPNVNVKYYKLHCLSYSQNLICCIFMVM